MGYDFGSLQCGRPGGCRDGRRPRDRPWDFDRACGGRSQRRPCRKTGADVSGGRQLGKTKPLSATPHATWYLVQRNSALIVIPMGEEDHRRELGHRDSSKRSLRDVRLQRTIVDQAGSKFVGCLTVFAALRYPPKTTKNAPVVITKRHRCSVLLLRETSVSRGGVIAS